MSHSDDGENRWEDFCEWCRENGILWRAYQLVGLKNPETNDGLYEYHICVDDKKIQAIIKMAWG